MLPCQWVHRRARKPLQLTLVMVVAVAVALLSPRPAHAWADVRLELGDGVYNPSLVIYQGSAWVVARSTQLRWDTTGLKWIMNRARLCHINTTDWSTISCCAFDPYRGRYGVQCRWGSDEWQVPWEAWGVDDTKLFAWPGRGLWAITGRRPQRSPDTKYCPQVVFRQWLVQLAAEGAAPDPSAFDFPPDETIPDVTFVDRQQPAEQTAAADSVLHSARRQLLQQHGVPEQQRHGLGGVLEAEGSSWSRLTGGQRQLLQPGRSDDMGSLAGAGDYQLDQQQQQQQQQPGRQRQRKRKRRLRKHRRLVPRPLGSQQAASTAAGTGANPLPPLPVPLVTPQQASTTSSSTTTTTTSSSSSSTDSWEALLGAQPVPLHIRDAAAVYGTNYAISEKNWMPFIYEGDLFVTYSLAPLHRTYLLHPDGSAEPKYEAESGDAFSVLGAAASKVHGGPPMVRVDAGLLASSDALGAGSSSSSSSSQAYYLGVAHYWEAVEGSKEGRAYKHFFIKVEAQPPFRVLQVSRALPLQHNPHYKQVAFVSGLELAMLPAGTAAAAASMQPAAAAGSSSVAGSAARLLLLEGPHSQQVPAGSNPPSQDTMVDSSSSRRSSSRLLLGQAPAVTIMPVEPIAAPAGSDSSGSLGADADADEFSWDVRHRAPDVNIFSWTVEHPNSPAAGQQQGTQPPGAVAAAAAAPAAAAIPAGSSTAGHAAAEGREGPAAGTPAASASSLAGPVNEATGGPAVNATAQPKPPAATAQPPEQDALLPADPEPQGEVLLGSETTPTAASEQAAAVLAPTAPAPQVPAPLSGRLVPHILVSYGSGDWESRLAVLTLQDVEALFEQVAD